MRGRPSELLGAPPGGLVFAADTSLIVGALVFAWTSAGASAYGPWIAELIPASASSDWLVILLACVTVPLAVWWMEFGAPPVRAWIPLAVVSTSAAIASAGVLILLPIDVAAASPVLPAVWLLAAGVSASRLVAALVFRTTTYRLIDTVRTFALTVTLATVTWTFRLGLSLTLGLGVRLVWASAVALMSGGACGIVVGRLAHPTAANPQHRGGLRLVGWTLVLCAVAGALVGMRLQVPSDLSKADECFANQLAIQQAAQEYVRETGRRPATLGALIASMPRIPTCPDGGEYLWHDPDRLTVECTVHGYWAQSR